MKETPVEKAGKIFIFGTAYSGLLKRVEKATGCGGKELFLLFLAASEDGCLKRTLFRDMTGMKSSNLCSLLKKMEPKRLLAYNRTMIFLTPEGMKKVREYTDFFLAIYGGEEGLDNIINAARKMFTRL